MHFFFHSFTSRNGIMHWIIDVRRKRARNQNDILFIVHAWTSIFTFNNRMALEKWPILMLRTCAQTDHIWMQHMQIIHYRCSYDFYFITFSMHQIITVSSKILRIIADGCIHFYSISNRMSVLNLFQFEWLNLKSFFHFLRVLT